MGNGAKAQQKRDRAGANGGKKEPKSQLKSNAASQTIKCVVCFSTMQSTSSAGVLQLHAENKHSKTLKECFPDSPHAQA